MLCSIPACMHMVAYADIDKVGFYFSVESFMSTQRLKIDWAWVGPHCRLNLYSEREGRLVSTIWNHETAGGSLTYFLLLCQHVFSCIFFFLFELVEFSHFAMPLLRVSFF